MSDNHYSVVPKFGRRIGWIASAFAGALVLAAAAIPAIASAAGTNPVYHACVTTKTGAIKIASATAHCANGQYKISWNSTGPRGATGRPGPAGANIAYNAANENPATLSNSVSTPVAAMYLPRGNYVVTVNGTAWLTGASVGSLDTVMCTLGDPANLLLDFTNVTIAEDSSGVGYASISLATPVTGGGNIVLSCTDGESLASVSGRSITAIPVSKVVPAPPHGLAQTR